MRLSVSPWLDTPHIAHEPLRTTTNKPFRRLAGMSGHRAIDIQKTIQIHAPVDQVFEFLANYENFPQDERPCGAKEKARNAASQRVKCQRRAGSAGNDPGAGRPVVLQDLGELAPALTSALKLGDALGGLHQARASSGCTATHRIAMSRSEIAPIMWSFSPTGHSLLFHALCRAKNTP